MYDWFDREGYVDEVIEPVDEMPLCANKFVYLKPGQVYKFYIDPNCNICKELNVYEDLG